MSFGLPIFPDFRAIPFRIWIERHREHNTENVIGDDSGRSFRFIRCNDCNEAYYMGEIIPTKYDL